MKIDKYFHLYFHLYGRKDDVVLEEIEKPELRQKGKWIEDGYNGYKAVCSECGEPCASYVMGKPRDNFCKWCGADMRGDKDDQL